MERTGPKVIAARRAQLEELASALRAPDQALARAVATRGPGALLIRMVPVLAGTLVLLGLLLVTGVDRGWFGVAAGTALVVGVKLVVLVSTVVWAAGILDGVDARRREAEAELRRSELHYRELFDLNPLPTWVFDRETLAFLAVNEQAVRTYGYSRDELLGMTIEQIRPPEDIDRLRAHLADDRLLAAEVLWRHRRKDGSTLEVELTGHAIRFHGRDARLVVVHDITESQRVRRALELSELAQRRYATELEVANRELDAFAYSVSHDLRAPLRAIDGFSLAVLEDHGERLGSEGQEHLRRVRAGAQRMALLIDDLLQLSRVARAEMSREPLDLAELAESVVADLRKQEPERRVAWRSAGDLRAAGDPRLLRVALENLLGNAWKYSRREPDAAVELVAETLDGAPVYRVRDNGVGFEMAYVDKLFSPFQRLHRAEEFEGTGIGLATVQRIVHRHGGRVWAQGEPGRGATISFTLRGEAS